MLKFYLTNWSNKFKGNFMKETIFKGQYTPIKKEIKKRALLVIDVQNEYFDGKLPVCYPKNTLPNILIAIKKANENSIPVVIIQHTLTNDNATAFIKNTHGWQLHKSLENIKYNYYIEKNLPSAFVGTNLQEWLDKNSIDTVVISGYMTQFCCDTTAKYAMHLGYNVEFLSDATATLGFENSAGKVSAKNLHNAILVQQAARFSYVLTTKEWIDKFS
jgi:nicotinamidase-related amidase